MSINIRHTRTAWSHDYDVTKEGMSIGTFRIMLYKREGSDYLYTIVHGGECILEGSTKVGRRIDAMRYTRNVLFNYVRYGEKGMY